VLPVTQYEIDGSTGEIGSEFFGAVGFAVDAGGISEVGRVTHADGASSPGGVWPGIRRILVVDGTLLTLSDLGLEAASLEDLTEGAWLPFAP
jgi:hypothetical protein